MPHSHNKRKFDKYIQFAKKSFTWGKEKLSQRGVQISIAILVTVMLMLGLTINWQCSNKGWSCGGGYTPPNPDDVNKIIKLEKKHKP